jgi:chromate reductase
VTDVPGGDIRLVALGGSLREHSINRHVLNAAVRIARAYCEVDVVDVAILPLYDQDYDPGMGGEGLPPVVSDFEAAVGRSDGIILVSPEYNWGVPGYLKNAIDWVSHPPRDSVLVGRPTLLMGASIGAAGTTRANASWRQIFLSTRTPVLTDSLQVPHAHTRVNADGTVDEALEREIGVLVTMLIDDATLARNLNLRETLRKPRTRPIEGVYPRTKKREAAHGHVAAGEPSLPSPT